MLVVAEVPTWIHDAGVLAASVTAVVTALTIGTRSRLGRWVVRKIREDMAKARRDEMGALLDVALAPVMAQLLPNGGSSFRDEVRRELSATRSRIDALVVRVDAGERDRSELWRIVERQVDTDQQAREGHIERREA